MDWTALIILENDVNREEVDLMALCYLRDNGPDTPGVIETEEILAAWLVYADLLKRKLVKSTDFGGGQVQFVITDAGREFCDG